MQLYDVCYQRRWLWGKPQGGRALKRLLTIGISKTTPIEVMEQYYSVLFEEYSLHEGSGGAGSRTGGFGVNYKVRLPE